MVRFHGDLLLGGVALRDLEGELPEHGSSDPQRACGHFRIRACAGSALEVGRPYLLLLKNGTTQRVVVTRWDDAPQQMLDVHFQALAAEDVRPGTG